MNLASSKEHWGTGPGISSVHIISYCLNYADHNFAGTGHCVWRADSYKYEYV